MADSRRSRRGIRIVLTLIVLALGALSALNPPGAVARAQGPDTPPAPGGPPACPVARVAAARGATVTVARQTATLGPLFSGGGHFAEHGVDEPCDEDDLYGPFFVSMGGRLTAHVVGEPPVPSRWALGNWNTALSVFYEPYAGRGRTTGRGRTILSLYGQGVNNDLTGSAEWDGPGLLYFWVGGPWGKAPLSYSCYEQNYQASAEIVELYPTGPAGPGLTVLLGDTITTDAFGSATLTLDGNGAGVRLAPNTSVTLNSAQEAVPGTDRVSLWFRPKGVAVQEPGELSADSIDLGMPEWLLELKGRVRDLAGEGYLMPGGYADDESMFWFGFREGTLLEAYNGIKDLQDPAEAATQFRLYMESRRGQWTMLNAADRGLDLFSDLAMTWLLPNEYNAAESLVKWLVRPVPILGQIANLKNSKDTFERVMKEVVYDAASRRSARALTTFEGSRGWTEDQVHERTGLLRRQIEQRREAVTAAREQMLAAIKPLQDYYNGLGCGAGAEGGGGPQGAQAELCRVAEWELHSGRARAKAEFEATLRSEMAAILEAELEITDLTAYRLPIARKDYGPLKRSPSRPIEGGPDLCLPRPAQMILRTGAAHIFRSRELAPLFIYVADTYVIPKGTELTVEVLGEGRAVVRVFEGEAEVLATGGRRITVPAGREVALPEGTLSPLGGEAYRAAFVDGLPLRELPLDEWEPQPYGAEVAAFHPPLEPLSGSLRQQLGLADDLLFGRPALAHAPETALTRLERAVGLGLPAGWVWQETDPHHAAYAPGQAPQDSRWEVPEPGVLRVIVPNENDMWGHRDDAPRLLHKVTGDFDLEAEMLLQCAGQHFAMTEFIAFAPGSAAGYLADQFYLEGLMAQYLVLDGGWYRWGNINLLTNNNRWYRWGNMIMPWNSSRYDEAGIDPGDTPVLVRLSRRGDTFKTYHSTDGGFIWTLSSRRIVSLPETMWVGWVFKRMAQDGLIDELAVTTLRHVRLRTAPVGSMLEAPWDLVPGGGEAIAGEVEVLMSKDGSRPGYVQVYSSWAIEGDFDLVVRFEAPAIEAQPGQERYIHLGVTSNDESNHAYIRNAISGGRHSYDVDMSIDSGWGRYQTVDGGDDVGRLRLMRHGGLFSAFYERDGEWLRLDQWTESFADPVYLDLRYDWISSEPLMTHARFTIESLTTPDGAWFGPAPE